MTLNWIIYICLFLGLISALVAGVFQSFSDFVMRALIRAEPAAGVQAMQNINVTVFRSIFLASFLLLTPITIALAAYAWFYLSGYGQAYIITAAIIYVTTVFLVTIAGNVPMNEKLATMPHAAPQTHTYWETYGRIWTRYNHIRTLGSAATAVCLLLAAVSF